MIRVTRRLGGPGAVCRVLSGQRYPEITRDQGLDWVVACIEQVIPLRASTTSSSTGEPLQGRFWNYPEFAQKQDVFLELLARIPSAGISACSTTRPTPSWPATIRSPCSRRGGPGREHACSDRYLAEGSTLDELRQTDGTLGYSPTSAMASPARAERLRRDFPNSGGAPLSRLGQYRRRDERMEEMAESLAFLRTMSAKYFPEDEMERLRTALIGCGKVGQLHAAALSTCRSRTSPQSATRPSIGRSRSQADTEPARSPTWPRCSRRRRSRRSSSRPRTGSCGAGDPGRGGRGPCPGRETLAANLRDSDAMIARPGKPA